MVIENLYHRWNGPKHQPQKFSYKYELHNKTWMNYILATACIGPVRKVLRNIEYSWDIQIIII